MPSKAAFFQATLLEEFFRSARAEIIPAQLLGKFLVAVDDAHATLYFFLGREARAALAHRLEKNGSCSRSKSFWPMIHRLSGQKKPEGFISRVTPVPAEWFANAQLTQPSFYG
jgi:hypothetical protein